MCINKKTVSVIVPIYNEVQMVEEIYDRVNAVFKKLDRYSYELVFFDDGSTDGTQERIEKLSSEHKEVKAVFYSKNFGYLKNTFYSVQQAKGDCAIILHADLQNPPEVIPEFIEKWESGTQVVLGVKNKSRENKIMYFLRTVFYFIMTHFFKVKLPPHATEFELFDKSFIEILKKIKTNAPFLRGIISEYASTKDFVYYTQDARKKGESKFNFKKYYEFAICGITQYSSNIPRLVIMFSIFGILAEIVEIFVVLFPTIHELSAIEISNCILIRLVVFILFVLFILSSMIWEYIIFIVTDTVEKPLVVEEKRINY